MTMNSKNTKSVITKKDFWSVFFRSLTLDASWNYERMQNLAYAYAMAPIIRRLYKNNEEKKAALERHLEFMSVTPHISTLLLGISGAMEEENAKNHEFNSASINAVKTSLMGPMSGIGDSFFWGTLKVIATGVAISLSKQGNIFGPIAFLLIINIPHFALRYICLDKGFKLGAKFFSDVEDSGVIEKVTTAASILGLMVIGWLWKNRHAITRIYRPNHVRFFPGFILLSYLLVIREKSENNDTFSWGYSIIYFFGGIRDCLKFNNCKCNFPLFLLL